MYFYGHQLTLFAKGVAGAMVGPTGIGTCLWPSLCELLPGCTPYLQRRPMQADHENPAISANRYSSPAQQPVASYERGPCSDSVVSRAGI